MIKTLPVRCWRASVVVHIDCDLVGITSNTPLVCLCRCFQGGLTEEGRAA